MNLEPRAYQAQIIDSVKRNGNTLVVLPTGLGKTLIALSLMEKTISEGGNALFLTPTKPLARQHAATIQNTLDLAQSDVAFVTGEIPGHKRQALYSSKICVSTPQTIRNDIRSMVYPANNTKFVVFDEAHRAVGGYAYVEIAGSMPEGCLFLALTASPGGDLARIREVLSNLRIRNIEIRTESDEDVRPFVKNLAHNWISVELSPRMREADSILSSLADAYAQRLARSFAKPPVISKRQFVLYGQRLRAMRHPAKYTLLSHYYTLLHIIHMQELMQTQGPYPFLSYLQKLENSSSKSAKILAKSQALSRAKQLLLEAGDHPKTERLLRLLSSLRGKKVIVFVQYRDQIKRIKELLDAHGFSSRIFVGKKDGFTRRMQEETMDVFRRDGFSILIASSIGEEGLDIPAVDSVIFHEPIPSEIRSIQRRGRAGRFRDGSVYILMAKSTRDEHYYWASKKREMKMKEILLSLQKALERNRPALPGNGQSKLGSFM
ncbi:MAG: DEAD/DEAH box helicase family protein [Candidatus Micrarchaeota archaeon]